MSRNNIVVYVYLTGTAIGKRLSRQPHLLTLAKEMLAETTLVNATAVIEHDMRREIGYDFIVDTTSTDAVFYARLVKDEVYTRFVKTKDPKRTSYLTVTLRQDGDNNYELSDIWIGRITPPRPGSSAETANSKPFWSSHACILVDQPFQIHTLTKICPY